MRVVEEVYCKECGKDTKRMFVSKSVPKQMQWKCSECGHYNIKKED